VGEGVGRTFTSVNELGEASDVGEGVGRTFTSVNELRTTQQVTNRFNYIKCPNH